MCGNANYTLFNEHIVILQLNPKSCSNIQHCQPYKTQIWMVDKYSGFCATFIAENRDFVGYTLQRVCREGYSHAFLYIFPPCEESLTCNDVTLVSNDHPLMISPTTLTSRGPSVSSICDVTPGTYCLQL